MNRSFSLLNFRPIRKNTGKNNKPHEQCLTNIRRWNFSGPKLDQSLHGAGENNTSLGPKSGLGWGAAERACSPCFKWMGCMMQSQVTKAHNCALCIIGSSSLLGAAAGRVLGRVHWGEHGFNSNPRFLDEKLFSMTRCKNHMDWIGSLKKSKILFRNF